MRFVHSLSTRPLGIQLYDSNALQRLVGNILYYALSLAYLKRLHQEVVLYTDTLGERLLGHLPYNKIYVTLDDMPEEISPRFWASAKMHAMSQEPIESVHIDGDVFIKDQKLIDLIENSDWDLLVQMYEHDYFSPGYYKEFPFWKKDKDFLKENGINIDVYGAYNTGILGFRNQELKDTFLNLYKKLAINHSKVYWDELLTNPDLTPDLVTEQTAIYQLSKDYKVKLLIDPKSDQTIREVCNNLGYQHVITMYKYKQLDKCIEMLKQISPEIYNKTYKLCRNILKKYK